MNLIIEVIDGVAYAVGCTNGGNMSCNICEVRNPNHCKDALLCTTKPYTYYRRLTQTEREELQKAIGRGIE